MVTGPIFDTARAHDYDRYLAALLAPREARDDLMAIAAFSGETARIPAIATDATIGEIRLQWWRDALPGLARGETTGNPLADALGDAIRRHSLPLGLFLGVLDARSFDLYPDPMPDEQTFRAYLAKTEGALIELALRVLGGWPPGVAVGAIVAAGQGVGLARVLAGLPHALSRGRSTLPQPRLAAVGIAAGDLAAVPLPPNAAAMVAGFCRDARGSLAAAGPEFRRMTRRQRIALLPAALVEPQLRALERKGHHPGRDLAPILPLTRVWSVWRAYASGRL